MKETILDRKFSVTYDKVYFGMAVHAICTAIAELRTADLGIIGTYTSPEEGKARILGLIRARGHAAIAIVFSAITLEACINSYAKRQLGGGYFDKHIVKMDLRTKWVVVPTLATGQGLPRDEPLYHRLGELAKHRNGIAHPKPRKRNYREVLQEAQDMQRRGGEAVEVAREALRWLASVDPTAKVDWLEEVESEYIDRTGIRHFVDEFHRA